MLNLSDKFQGVADLGPVYAETVLGRFPVEPLNTFSNLVFLWVAIYWAGKTHLAFRRHPVTVTSLPILVLGFIGGTLYHATRACDFWRLLDVYPIIMLALFASAYLWFVVFGNSLKALVAITVPSLGYRILTETLTESQLALIGLGYAFLVFIILAPALIACRRRKWKGSRDLGLAFSLFAVALMLRQLDDTVGKTVVSHGTHFLWHILGGISVFFAFRFLFGVEETGRRAGA